MRAWHDLVGYCQPFPVNDRRVSRYIRVVETEVEHNQSLFFLLITHTGTLSGKSQ
jgi:hypothetical protein